MSTAQTLLNTGSTTFETNTSTDFLNYSDTTLFGANASANTLCSKGYADSLVQNSAIEYITTITVVTPYTRYNINHGLNLSLDNLKIQVYAIGNNNGGGDLDFPFNDGDILDLSNQNYVGSNNNEFYGIYTYSKADVVPAGDTLNNITILTGSTCSRAQDITPTDSTWDDLNWDFVSLKIVVYSLEPTSV